MEFFSPWLSPHRLGRLALIALLPAGLLRAVEDPVAVFSQVFNGYARTRLPDKSFKPEAYTFGEGGCWSRPVKDAALEEMKFLRVAQAVAAPLAHLNYRPARNSAEAELLILVFWGSTEGSRDNDPSQSTDRAASAMGLYNNLKPVDPKTPQSTEADVAQASLDSALWQLSLANEERDRLDDRNARILGYSDVVDRARSAAHMSFARDILAEVGDNRYYVVLQAYDFKTAAKEKKLKPLWTARISMVEAGHDFARSLDTMLRTAAPYLGQDSDGLNRYVVPEGRVEIGPAKVVEPPPAK